MIKFFSNPDAQGYLRGLAEEFGDSTNAVRIELLKLEQAGLLESSTHGQRVMYEVNKTNPFYTEIVSMVSKYLGFNDLIDMVLGKIGNLQEAYVVGDYARGIDSGTIKLVLVGYIDEDVLQDLITKITLKIQRKIEVRIVSKFEDDKTGDTLKLM